MYQPGNVCAAWTEQRKYFKILTLAAPRRIKVGPRPIVYMDLSITDTRKGRIPTGLGKKKSREVQMATAIQRSTENNGERVPRKKGESSYSFTI